MSVVIREAELEDIPIIQLIRNSVHENQLSDPNLVTDQDCEEFLFKRGRGWVAEINDHLIVGFGIVDLKENNIWALFLHPDYEGRGIGKILHHTMLEWYFNQTRHNIWLGTSPNTRAETVYRRLGWNEIGTHGKEEIKFEMTFEYWEKYIK